jgi:hypothetical protein
VTRTPPGARCEVNYFGVLNMTRAFAPLLGANGGRRGARLRPPDDQVHARPGWPDRDRAVDAHATDRDHGPGQQGVLCHTMINFV